MPGCQFNSLNLGSREALDVNLEFRSISKCPFQLDKVTGVALVRHQFNSQHLSTIQGCLRSATCSTLQDPWITWDHVERNIRNMDPQIQYFHIAFGRQFPEMLRLQIREALVVGKTGKSSED